MQGHSFWEMSILIAVFESAESFLSYSYTYTFHISICISSRLMCSSRVLGSGGARTGDMGVKDDGEGNGPSQHGDVPHCPARRPQQGKGQELGSATA